MLNLSGQFMYKCSHTHFKCFIFYGSLPVCLDKSNFFRSSCRVKLAVNRETQEAIAVKIIDLEKATEKDCYDNVRKEVGIKVARSNFQ